MRDLFQNDLDEYEPGEKSEFYTQFLVSALSVVCIAMIVGGFFLLKHLRHEDATPVSDAYETTDPMPGSEDSESASPDNINKHTSDNNSSVTVNRLISSNAQEIPGLTKGIDVSHYQGTINWEKLSQSSDISFVMIRIGQRMQDTGEIIKDANAEYNLQQAAKNGLKIGVYFSSCAIDSNEALAEADWVTDLIAPYPITYPVVYDCEGYQDTDSRQHSLSKSERTEIAMAFLNRVYEKGYTPMFYASMSALENERDWITSRLESSYKIWVSWYSPVTWPEQERPAYSGIYDMWQYTDNAIVNGIYQNVDLNVAYFGYTDTAPALEEREVDVAFPDVEILMDFIDVEETVTAKEITNLRDIPSQGEESTVMVTLQNGQTATRTGLSNSGWSRVVYNGNTYYAVSNYLTTDLTVKSKTSEPFEDDGIKTEFTAINDQVSPKIEVNLRTLPSVTNPDSVVVTTIPYGTVITRTGINNELGWSRVEYNDQTLYCISSYIYVVE